MTQKLTQAQQLLQAVPDPDAQARAEFAAMSPLDKMRSKLVSGADLMNLPEQQWVIPGLLFRQSLVMFYGPSGSGKSFMAMDLSGSFLTGRDWQGVQHDTTGPVLYFAGEGQRGVLTRMVGWCEFHGIEPMDVLADFHLYPTTVALHDSATWGPAAVEMVRDVQPALIIIDTLAAFTPGASDSADKEMAEFMDTCTRMAAVSNAVVVFIHHTNKGQKEYRGSTALYGGADTVLALSGSTDAYGVMTMEKQKDSENAEPWHVAYEKQGTDPETGKARTLVARALASPPRTVENMTERAGQLMDSLRRIAGPEGVAAGEWSRATQDLHKWGRDEGNTRHTTAWSMVRKHLEQTGQIRTLGTKARSRYLPNNPEQMDLLQ
jgi:hypothetical protein